MNEIKQISSLQNPLIKKVVLLKEKKRGRNKSGLFVLEGVREMQMALKGGYTFDTVFFYPDILSKDELYTILDGIISDTQIVELSKEVYQRVAYREKTEGVLAIAKTKSHELKDLKFTADNPLVLVAEAPEKPGNIGALLRTADAAKLDAVIIANPRADLYNPNVIRSSVGCVFTVPLATGNNEEVISHLKSKGIAIVGASLQAAKNYTSHDYRPATAIVVGTESTGLTEEWIRHLDSSVVIPMQGEIDSMNVSVSAAILIFEARRQRTTQSQ
ncbi:MAG: TrmH family RNA methyltransferase [Flavobacteriaceae bacterium]